MKISIRSKLVTLILLLTFAAIALLTQKNLDFFRKDKETYVYGVISQVAGSQSRELDRSLTSLNHLMELFDTFSGTQVATQKRQNFLSNYGSFIFLTSLSPGSRATRFQIVDKSRLQEAGITTADILKDDRLKTSALTENIKIINWTKNTNKPVLSLARKSKSGNVVIGLVEQKSLIEFTGGKRVFETFVVDQQGSLIMHEDIIRVLAQENFSNHPLVSEWIKTPKIPKTKEYVDHNGEEFLGAYEGLSSLPLAVFIRVPSSQALVAAQRLVKDSSLFALLIFAIAGLVGVLFAYSLTRPIRKLVASTYQVAKGDFSVRIEKTTNDEIGELVTSFNRMGQELEVRDKKLEEAHQKLVQSEKMSAFGQMSAGIAHEVKNPLAGILGYAQLAGRKLKDDEGTLKYLKIIEKETKRCKDIIENLMKFARQEKSVFAPISIQQTVSDAIDLVDHQITLQGVKIVRELPQGGTFPQVMGNANQIQQVLMNLMLNAQHAMEEGGTLTVNLKENGNDEVYISIADTGHGIDPDNLKKIFEPFFTTKEAGKGTGLGLAVSFGIIRDHNGDIEVNSEVGKGTEFKIKLPTSASPNAPAERKAE